MAEKANQYIMDDCDVDEDDAPRNTSAERVPRAVPESREGAYDNLLSPKLNQLIAAAIADGEISDMERQVLIRNAQAENVAMDEFVMILEARLFEQRRVLRAQEDAMARAKLEAQPKTQERRRPADSTRCPHCGAPVKLLASRCPECGYDYPVAQGASASAFEKLNAALAAIDNEGAKGLIGKYISLMGAGADTPDKLLKKKRVIETFPIPSDKQGIFDFFVACAPLSKPESFFQRNGLEGSYKKKAEQVLLKARVVLKDDMALLNEINELAKQYKIKA